MPICRIFAGALFSLGCAYLGWTLGLAFYSLAYEILRAQNSEGALESRNTLEFCRTGCWIAGLACGAALYWLWHRGERAPLQGVRRTLALMLGSVGATHLGYLLINGAAVEAMVSIVFLSFIGGCAFMAACHGALYPLRAFSGRLALALGASFTALFLSLAFDKAVMQRYDTVGKERILWLRVEFPPDVPRTTPEQIAITLRTATQSVKCFAIAWEKEADRSYLPMRCDFLEQTADRVVVIALPDRQPVEIIMPFARNPVPMHDYSAWQKSGALNFRYRVT